MRDRVIYQHWKYYEGQIIKKRQAGLSYLRIAKDLHIGENFVKTICRGNGLV